MMSHIARQDCCTSHCPFGRVMAASQPDKSVALGSVCYCSAPGSYSLRSWPCLVITDLAHEASNRSMRPTTQVTTNFSVHVNSFFGLTDNASDYNVFAGFGYRAFDSARTESA